MIKNNILVCLLDLENVSQNLIEKASKKISEDRKLKAESINDKALKNLTIGAGILLKYGLKKLGQNSNYKTGVGEFGKPYFLGENSDIKYSISHSKNVVMVAFSNTEVGVDVQFMDAGKVNVSDKILSKQELVEIEKDKEKIIDNFYEFWVKKESYLKLEGLGIREKLKNVDTIKLNGYNFIVQNYKDYVFSVCSRENKQIILDVVDIEKIDL